LETKEPPNMEDHETRRKIIREWMAKTSSIAVGAIRPRSFGAIRTRN